MNKLQKKMKKRIKLLVLFLSVFAIFSCEKDAGKLPGISFKTGGVYISSDVTLDKGSNVTIGINASKSEKRDVLKKLNISKRVNGGGAISIIDKVLNSSEEDNLSYDYTDVLDTISGQVSKYTFTVTNRDGLVNQVSLSITTK